MELCTNIDDLQMYLRIFREDMANRQSVETPFGLQNVSSGYQIKSINLYESFVKIEIYMKDRLTRENDEYIRGGDTAYFTIKDGKVYSDKEWEAYVDSQDLDSIDNDR